MTHFQIIIFSIILFLLIFLSGFFSMSETSLMAVNRYRLRHKARLNKRHAILTLKLLKRPDRLLGMILIGNNLANIIASALATLMAVKIFGEKGVIFSTILLTFLVLIFAEVAPKTVAALYPEKVSRFVVGPVHIMLMIFYPFVWFINVITNSLLRLFHIRVSNHPFEPLSREELRSVVYDTAGKLSRQYQSMLLGILDLNKVSVDDVMIPRHEITGIDIEKKWSTIKDKLANSQHDWLPVYRETVNAVIGILHLRETIGLLMEGKLTDKDQLIKMMKEPYFVPEGTPLNIQLLNFQRQHKRLALIVDEYGEIKGLITLEDILEEIVGEFTTSIGQNVRVELQQDGSYLVDGATTLRELNRVTQWNLPTQGARTLSGMIIDYLETMPRPGTCVKISGYPIEIVQVKKNRIARARIFPQVP